MLCLNLCIMISNTFFVTSFPLPVQMICKASGKEIGRKHIRMIPNDNRMWIIVFLLLFSAMMV